MTTGSSAANRTKGFRVFNGNTAPKVRKADRPDKTWGCAGCGKENGPWLKQCLGCGKRRN